jgi:hypothetical protein
MLSITKLFCTMLRSGLSKKPRSGVRHGAIEPERWQHLEAIAAAYAAPAQREAREARRVLEPADAAGIDAAGRAHRRLAQELELVVGDEGERQPASAPRLPAHLRVEVARREREIDRRRGQHRVDVRASRGDQHAAAAGPRPFAERRGVDERALAGVAAAIGPRRARGRDHDAAGGAAPLRPEA